MRLVLGGLLLAGTAHAALQAQQCAATPEAAARAAIGVSTAASGSGFRVDDVQIDPVMKRVWMRVVRCDDANAPAVLVPVAAPLHSGPLAVPAAVTSLLAPTRTPASPALVLPMSIHAGDAVQAILATSAMHMTLDAVANQPGSVGDVISLTLKRRPGQATDEPDHRIRGIVRADKTVEVQP